MKIKITLAAVIVIAIVSAFAFALPKRTDDMAKYGSMSYSQLKAQMGAEAEMYHANFYTLSIPGTDVTAVLMASGYNEELACPVLEATDSVVRFEGRLDELLPNFKEAMITSRRTFEGAGTAYYISDIYTEFTIDVDGDGYDDMIITAPTNGKTPSQDSHVWMIIL